MASLVAHAPVGAHPEQARWMGLSDVEKQLFDAINKARSPRALLDDRWEAMGVGIASGRRSPPGAPQMPQVVYWTVTADFGTYAAAERPRNGRPQGGRMEHPDGRIDGHEKGARPLLGMP